MQLFNRSSKARDTSVRAATPSGIEFFLTQPAAGTNRNGAGSVTAFTSANSAAGVSHVVRKLAAQLATQTRESTAIIETACLASLRAPESTDLRARCARTNIDQLWMLRKSTNGNGHHPSSASSADAPDTGGGFDCVQQLRSTFRHTFLDCPPISESSEVAFLAPQVDGVVLIVEADFTKREQILRARQTIEMAGGKLVGMVLNKRRHVVPQWLYRML